MDKTDYKKILRHLYQPSPKNISIADVPPMNFLMIGGQRNPHTSPDFSAAIEALFSLAFNNKFFPEKLKTILRQPVTKI